MGNSVGVREVDVLIVGGGCSGVAALLQAVCMGARVLVVEESPWLGGMITAAGVSCIDGNEGALGGGIFGAFRAAMEQHYGGPEAVRTGWVSNTCFEPQVAAAWFRDAVAASTAECLHGARLVRVLREEQRIAGAVFEHGGAALEVRAHVTIEATEYGDVLALGEVPFRLGRESRAETGEAHAPEEADDEIQDLTMVATLRRVQGGAKPVLLPPGQDTARFHNSTAVHAKIQDPAYWNHKLHSWESFLTYALLPESGEDSTPGDLFMLNWPFHSNDYPAQGLFGTPEERASTLAAAKERTLAYVHYMQTELGHPEWGLAEDVYPTADHLPLLPYVRESRRVVPVRWLREEDVVPRDGSKRNAVQPDGVAVGDYYLDHHHDKDHRPPGERLGECFPSNAPFQIPYSAMLPREVNGLIAAEKSIGATHIVNGCSRLQPVALLIGQAAGAAAALAVRDGCEPREVDVTELQSLLLAAGAQIVPDRDCPNTLPDFAERQRALLAGG
ncbi:putative FAD-binding dehydrogenase [Planctomycetes bacterium Poly30]|uniref:Putative FAD-binding dehydrogenase n=1 Tax=Saltatorellus ferox TaxID=2528018 RepID=A0A518ERN9_9BACT|nr:putative FAD-binding dehydrogenase [Planctomycetes bacterium Poly30]